MVLSEQSREGQLQYSSAAASAADHPEVSLIPIPQWRNTLWLCLSCPPQLGRNLCLLGLIEEIAHICHYLSPQCLGKGLSGEI